MNEWQFGSANAAVLPVPVWRIPSRRALPYCAYRLLLNGSRRGVSLLLYGAQNQRDKIQLFKRHLLMLSILMRSRKRQTL
jgi:hypothetical protein